MITENDFLPQSDEQNRQGLADVLPRGKAFCPKNQKDTNLYKFLQAIGKEEGRYQALIDSIIKSYIPNFDDSYIVPWENALGIPDDCFSNTGTNEERRRNIIIKFAYLSLKTAEDYFNLATILGLEIEIRPTSDDSRFPLTFPITFGSPFVLEITIDSAENPTFPLIFPIIFGNNNIRLFECLVNKYKKAYIDVIIKYTNPIEFVPILDGSDEVITDGDENAIVVENSQ